MTTAFDWTALSMASGETVLTVSTPSVRSTIAERPPEVPSVRRVKVTASRRAVLPPSGIRARRANSDSGCSGSKRSRRWVWSNRMTSRSWVLGSAVRKRVAASCERRSVSSMLSLVSTSSATSSAGAGAPPGWPTLEHSSIVRRLPSSVRTKSRAVSPGIG